MTIRRLQKQLSLRNAQLQQEIGDRQIAEAKLRNLFENAPAPAPVGIFSAQLTDGLIIEANQYFVNMLGYSHAKDVIEQKLLQIYLLLHHCLGNFKLKVR